ncbi:MAG: peroxiredoxin family protein [Persephonella sp.]|nr:MAG: peroxiredoxin family protein [Persephonella sp.]
MATKVGIIVLSGNIDKVLPAFMLANTSASMGLETGMFFSFYGINVLHKQNVKNLNISTDGAKFFANFDPQLQNLSDPQLIEKTTQMFTQILTQNKMPSIEDMVKQAIDLGVKLYPCNTAIKLFNFKQEELIEGVEKPVGASTFLNFINSGDKAIVMNF